MINTLGISLIKLVINFPLPIIFALLLNEVKNQQFKKIVQTISYMPHFLSWVVLGGILTTWMGESGLFNELLSKYYGILFGRMEKKNIQWRFSNS
jgi:putative aldouronate transport system permease protein